MGFVELNGRILWIDEVLDVFWASSDGFNRVPAVGRMSYLYFYA